MKRILLGSAALALLNSAAYGADVVTETVVVTAQHRLQPLADVPISIHVLGSDELAQRNVQDMHDAFNATANVQFNMLGDGADGAGIAIRGVSAAGVFGVDQAVPFYVDGILLGSEASLNPALYDLQRVEILRGPQGTLYGRDALGGAVSIVTTKPDPAAGGGYVEGTVGSYGELGIKGSANIPLSDESAVRVTAFGLRSNGYVHNTLDPHKFMNGDQFGGRVQWLYRPAANWEFVLSGDYFKDDSRKYGIGDRNTVPRTLSVDIAVPFPSRNQSYGLALSSTWTGNLFDVVSLSAWRGSTAGGVGGNYSPSPLIEQGYTRQYNQLSQEVRLVSHPGGPIDWVAGIYAFGYKEHRLDFYGFSQSIPADSFFPGQPPLDAGYQEISVPRITAENFAAFGDATYHVTDRLDLVAGGRVSFDHRDIHYNHHSNYPAPGFSFFAPTQILDQSNDTTTFTPRVGVLYKATGDLNLYATISRGYKSGGYNPSFAASSDLYYKPESGWNYEIGLKGTSFDNAVSYSLSAFDFEWDNKQAYYYNGFFVTIANARAARSYGAEGALEWHLTDGLQFGAQVGLLSANFTDFSNAGDSSTGASVDATGFRLPLAPRLSSNLSAQYTYPIAVDGKLVARLDYNFRSRFYFDVLQQSPQGGYGLLNAMLSYSMPEWSVSLYGHNLSDQRYLSYAYSTAQGVAGAPRTFEVLLRRNF